MGHGRPAHPVALQADLTLKLKDVEDPQTFPQYQKDLGFPRRVSARAEQYHRALPQSACALPPLAQLCLHAARRGDSGRRLTQQRLSSGPFAALQVDASWLQVKLENDVSA